MANKVQDSQMQSLIDAISQGYTMTVKEAKIVLNYQELHIRSLCRKGRLKAVKVGGRWLIKPESAKEYDKAPKDVKEMRARLLELEREVLRLEQLTKE